MKADLEQGAGQGRRQSAALAILVVLQGLAAVFFVGDVAADLLYDPTAPHSILEAVVVLALLAGTGFGAWQLRLTQERLRRQERALWVARGALAEAIDMQFRLWGLTPAEQDVGLLALKGIDLAEIARLRGVAEGTVRAQLTRIYAKAGVSGRAQFAAWFVEDLLDGPPSEAPAPGPDAFG